MLERIPYPFHPSPTFKLSSIHKEERVTSLCVPKLVRGLEKKDGWPSSNSKDRIEYVDLIVFYISARKLRTQVVTQKLTYLS